MINYHIDYVTVCPPRLPLDPKSKHHPEGDLYFMAATRVVEACSEVRGGCEGCRMEIDCHKIFNALSDQCRNKPVQAINVLEFVTRFVIMLREDSENK
jgi:hypothetical protein